MEKNLTDRVTGGKMPPNMKKGTYLVQTVKNILFVLAVLVLVLVQGFQETSG